MFERLERELLFPATSRRGDPGLFEKLIRAERFWVERDDAQVEVWLLRAREAKAPLVVFAHGNGELIDDWAHPMTVLRDAGCHVALVEYRGYGRSTGVPSEASIVGDFSAAVDVLLETTRTDASRLVYLGRSLGGGVMCALAAERQPALLALASTFRSVPSLAKSLMGVPGFMITNRFDNEAVLRGYSGPVVISHGTLDELIPFSHAEALRDLCDDAVLIPRACGHNDWPLDWEDWVEELTGALASRAIL